MINKKAQVQFVALMFGIIVFVMAIALAPSLMDVSTDATTSMDCSNSSINEFTKGSCLLVDSSPFYFIGGLLAIVGLLIGAKIILEK